MTMTLAPSADEAIARCREVTRRRARNFYYGLKLLPEPQRSAMYAIYAWMRRADDLVDEPEQQPDVQEQRIEAFRSATDRAMSGMPDDGDYLWPALAFAAERFRLTSQPFHQMLDGQLDDVADRIYETFDQLREYCYRVASTVGLICITVWGYDDDRAPDLAIERGIAFQLTNILRDFREDFDVGRVYLPRENFDQHGLTPMDLRAWSKPESCEQFIREQIERTTAFYERSAPLDEMISPSCLPTLWAMTRIYRGLLEKMRDQPSQLVSDRRVRLSAWQKGLIAVKAKWFVGANGAAQT
jgi:15-cis-phytoene synthase